MIADKLDDLTFRRLVGRILHVFSEYVINAALQGREFSAYFPTMTIDIREQGSQIISLSLLLNILQEAGEKRGLGISGVCVQAGPHGEEDNFDDDQPQAGPELVN
jgi:hypothetical protein